MSRCVSVCTISFSRVAFGILFIDSTIVDDNKYDFRQHTLIIEMTIVIRHSQPRSIVSLPPCPILFDCNWECEPIISIFLTIIISWRPIMVCCRCYYCCLRSFYFRRITIVACVILSNYIWMRSMRRRNRTSTKIHRLNSKSIRIILTSVHIANLSPLSKRDRYCMLAVMQWNIFFGWNIYKLHGKLWVVTSYTERSAV